jgi:hypothetical protein
MKKKTVYKEIYATKLREDYQIKHKSPPRYIDSDQHHRQHITPLKSPQPHRAGGCVHRPNICPSAQFHSLTKALVSRVICSAEGV